MFSSGPTSQSGLKRGLPLLDTGEIAHTCVHGLALRQREQAVPGMKSVFLQHTLQSWPWPEGEAVRGS